MQLWKAHMLQLETKWCIDSEIINEGFLCWLTNDTDIVFQLNQTWIYKISIPVSNKLS